MFRVRFLLLHFSFSEWPFKYCEWTYCIPKVKIDSWHFDILQVVLDFVLENHHADCVCVCVMPIFWIILAIFLTCTGTAGFYYGKLLRTMVMITYFSLFPIQQYPCHFQHFFISQYFKDAQQVHIPYAYTVIAKCLYFECHLLAFLICSL